MCGKTTKILTMTHDLSAVDACFSPSSSSICCRHPSMCPVVQMNFYSRRRRKSADVVSLLMGIISLLLSRSQAFFPTAPLQSTQRQPEKSRQAVSWDRRARCVSFDCCSGDCWGGVTDLFWQWTGIYCFLQYWLCCVSGAVLMSAGVAYPTISAL